MKKFTAILLTVIMVACLFVSCDNSIAPTVTDETVSASFTEATSRSLTASLEEFRKGNYYWKYAAKKNTADGTGLNSGATGTYDETGAIWINGGSDATAPTDAGLGSVAGFSQGIWDFKLFAYKLVGTNYNLAYQGEVTGVSLKKGSANTVSVTVSPVAGDKGTLVLADTISLAPAKTTNVPTGLTKVYTVTALGGTAAISPDKNQTKQWTLDAGAYKVNVDFVKDGFTYASGSVVATVYSNITTTVSGDLAELVTKAEFDSSINPDVMNKEASSGSFDLGNLNQTDASDVTLKDGETETTSKVVARVPATAASQIIKTVAGDDAPDNTTVELALRVDTVSATNTTLELEIGMQATVTKTDDNKIAQSTHKVTELKDSTGASVISVVTIKLQPGLRNVVVKHNGNNMTDLNTNPGDQGYIYDANSGILTIKTSSFSPFTVTFDAPEYVAKIGNVSYTTLQGAVDASVAGDTIILQDDVVLSKSLVISGGKELTIDMNGFDISAPSRVIKIVHANVTLTGTGTIYELNDNEYGAVCLYGAETDKGANYSVVTVDENVTLRGWSGVFVSIDEAGTYKNYGIVANIKGKIVLPGMDSHATKDGAGIYINGSNKNTEGNVPVFNLDGAEITGNAGIYAAGYAKWNFRNVTIEADSEALSIKAGEFVIDGGTYKAKGEYADPSEDTSNGSVETGAALSMTSNDGYAHKIDVTVNSGHFESKNGYSVYEGIPNKKGTSTPVAAASYVTLRINGGEFVGNAEKGAIKLSKIKQPKVITGGSFTDLTSAIKYAADGASITLADDLIISSTLIIKNSITIDGGNHSLQPSTSIDMIKVDGNNIEVTIKNLNMYPSTYTGKDGINCGADSSVINIENVNISSCFKALHFIDCKDTDVVINNSSLESIYPFNVNGGNIKSFKVEKSVLKGWTSFSKPETNNMTYLFKNCEFGECYGYATLKPYGNTTLENCNFTSDYFEELEGGIASGTASPIDVNFNSCTIDGQRLTADLLHNMFNYQITSGSSSGDSTIDAQNWYIDGTKIGITATN